MSDKKSLTPVAAALGAVAAISLTGIQTASAESNPFAMQEMEGGYMQVAESSCGANCGGKEKAEEKKSSSEANCGGKDKSDDMESSSEANCGGKEKAEEMEEKKSSSESGCGANCGSKE